MNAEQDFQEEHLLEKHRRFVNSGAFYKIPVRELFPGDLVAIAKSYEGKVCQVSEIRGEELVLIVGFDDEEKEIMAVLPADEVRHAEDYSNAYLKFIGFSKMFRVSVEGNEMTTYLKAVDRKN